MVSLGNRHTTQRLNLIKYAPLLTNRNWQYISIPLHDLYTAGKPFDLHNAIQLSFGTWNDHNGFSISLNDIILN